MARRENGSGMGGGGGMMAPILSIATGLLIFVILIIFAPTIAGNVEAAQPALGATSDWNATHNTNLPNGASTWTTNVQILGVVVLIINGQFELRLRNWVQFKSIGGFPAIGFPLVKSIAVAMYYLKKCFLFERESETIMSDRVYQNSTSDKRHGITQYLNIPHVLTFPINLQAL